MRDILQHGVYAAKIFKPRGVLISEFARYYPHATPEQLESYVSAFLDAALTEVRHFERLESQHLIRYVGHGATTDERLVFKYELVEGGSLRQLMTYVREQQLPIPLWHLVQWTAEVCRGLHILHTGTGLVHRDVKPSNVLLTLDGHAKLADFGLAVPAYPEHTRNPGGTVGYMSPEQEQSNSPLLPASDIYSVGVLLLVVATGCSPTVRGAEREAALEQLPPELQQICRKCTHPDPGYRFKTAAALAIVLEDWVRDTRVFEERDDANSVLAGCYFGTLSKIRSEADAGHVTVLGPDSFPPAVSLDQARERVAPLVANAQIVDRLCQQIVAHGATASSAVRTLWSRMTRTHQALLIVASGFRRPRDLSGLRRLARALLAEEFAHPLEGLAELRSTDVDTASRSSLNVISGVADVAAGDEIDRALAELSHAGLLVRQEGGLYWMHVRVRDWVYDLACKREPIGVGNLHESIGYYYYHYVFQPSHDSEALWEALNHYMAAVSLADDDRVASRMQLVCTLLLRNRAELLYRGNGGRLRDWIRNVREFDVARIHLPANGHVEAIAARRSLDALYAVLCDLEGDAARASTDFRAAVGFRLLQVSHRLRELDLADQDVVALVGELRQQRGGIGRELAGVICEVLYSALERARLVLRMQSGAVAVTVFERVLVHVFDIGMSLQGVHCQDKAAEVFAAIQDHARALISVPSSGMPREAVGRMKKLDVKCAVRYMMAKSACVYTWDVVDPTLAIDATHVDNEKAAALDAVVVAYMDVRQELASGSGLEGSEYGRVQAQVLGLVARSHYLKARFDAAYELLESARAALEGENSANGRMASAICELRAGECLMLHADWELRIGVRDHRETSTRRARTMLAGAREAVRSARKLIESERGSVWVWTTVFLAEAQVAHEELLFGLVPGGQGGTEGISHTDALVREGLLAIRGGLDNIVKDHVRWRLFTILWWQLFLARSALKPSCVGESWGEWVQLCDECGLGWFQKRQEASELRSKWMGGHRGDTKVAGRDDLLRVEEVLLRSFGLE